jgi:cyclic nucleotide-binding protein
VLARVFGVLEGMQMAALAVGSMAAAGLVAAVGPRGALVAVGAFLPVAVAVAWPRLSAIESAATVPVRQLELLRSIPLFAPLSPPTLEGLAASLTPVEVAAERMVIGEGEVGDRFYVVDRGWLDVSHEGRKLGTLGPGDSFGEIALLRDVPRTASVRARTDARLFAMERGPFLAVVTGTSESAEAADRVVRTRLER